MRRATNPSTFAVAGSSHWTSSIAISSGPSAATDRMRPRTARDTTSRSMLAAGPLGPSAVSRTGRRALPGSAVASRSGSSRSVSDTKGSAISVSTARQAKRRRPSPRATPIACCQMVDLPIPGSPSMTSATGHVRAASRKLATTSRCSRRPTSPGWCAGVTASGRRLVTLLTPPSMHTSTEPSVGFAVPSEFPCQARRRRQRWLPLQRRPLLSVQCQMARIIRAIGH